MTSVDIDIKTLSGLTLDSRRVQEGYLFAAFPGSVTDGRKYIGDAIHNGASIILAPTGTTLPDGVDASAVKLVLSDNPRRDLALLAAKFYALQPDYTVAVTGTNGKTSTAHFVKQLWKSRGIKAASIGTLGVRGPGLVRSGSMTTPDPVSLHGELADMAAVGITHLAMEASSHGLDQYRLDGVRIRAAGFTNLTRDHMDYHGDMDHYFASKSRLFSEVVVDGGAAVLNADVPEFAALDKMARARGLNVISYGHNGAELKVTSVTPNPHGQHIVAEIFGQRTEIDLPLVGGFQGMNALCALGLVLSEGLSHKDDYIAALENLHGAPGRLQHVAGHPRGAAVYVDYAHTPDALETVLKALRPHTQGKLVCVFGCGGNRDTGKRPIMGKLAVDLADHVIVTDDNPRTERAEAIRSDIMEGAAGAQEIEGRRAAITQAVNLLQSGDVLVIAGKGHEQGQIFADYTEGFDDSEEATKAMQSMGE